MSITSTSQASPAEYAIKVINHTNRHIFLTGKAGTGKTTFLKNILQVTHKKAIVVAPTGIAAINAGGVTIHSQFQLPFGAFVPSRQFHHHALNQNINTPESLQKHMMMNNIKRNVLRELELLIIDEVSMLRADLLDAIDLVLRTIRKNSESFGGVQVLFIGDLHQLPPVVKDEEWQLLQMFYKSMLFFDAQVLQGERPLYIELDKIYRQTDLTFINLLNNLRNNEITQKDIELLNQYYKPDFKLADHSNTILLTTHNSKADSKNKEALNALPGKPFIFIAEIKGEFNENAYPVDKRLELKTGAQIMFIKNDPTGGQRFFNGKIATIKSIDNDDITVEFAENKETLTLEQYEWKNIRYEIDPQSGEVEEKEIGSFAQYPIKLAWAITVHKSQGLTFERAILDINTAFAPGQVYVALSRLKSLDGLILTAPALRLRISQDESVIEFGNTKEIQGDLEEVITKETLTFTKTFLQKCFNFNPLIDALKEHTATYTEKDVSSKKQKYQGWALQLLEDMLPYKAHADRFVAQLQQIMDSRKEDYLHMLSERIEKANNYFVPILKDLRKKIYNQKEVVRSEKKVKAYLKELEELEVVFYKQLREINKSHAFIKSLVNNTEFNKQAVNDFYEKNGLSTKKPAAQVSDRSSIEIPKQKNQKPEDKINSKLASFELFKQKMSIGEIAKIRNLVESTIETHLAHYVSTGEVNIIEVMSAEKANKIIEVAERLKDPSLAQLKKELREDCTFSELKFANALKKYKESLSEPGKST